MSSQRLAMQVNVPVHLPGKGPLSLALLGLAKSDMSLLNIATKLSPLIAAAVPTLDRPVEEEEDAQRARSKSHASASTLNGVCFASPSSSWIWGVVCVPSVQIDGLDRPPELNLSVRMVVCLSAFLPA